MTKKALNFHGGHTGGWRQKKKLRELGQVRTFERVISGVDIICFFKGDREYIIDKILELVSPNAKKTNFTNI